MSQAFLAQNDLIRMRDTSNNIVFDTTRKMPVLTGILTGSVYMPQRQDSAGTSVTDIGGVPYNPAFCFPALRISQSSVSESVIGAPNGVPYCGSGSTVAYQKWSTFSDGYFLTGARVITVAITTGNRIILIEDFVEWQGSNPVGACTVEYRVYVGQFV
ncbi:hypothetical protein Lumi_028 [Xylophilus phage Lumi]|nr:hypothetical protein Lumi_028 [Xylophilus phage Lumi]